MKQGHRLFSAICAAGFQLTIAFTVNAQINTGGNTITGYRASVAGGDQNVLSGDYSLIGSGEQNTNTAWYSVIAGGSQNTVASYWSIIGAGNLNYIPSGSDESVIGGGFANYAPLGWSVIGGGYQNTNASLGFIGGGQNNKISSSLATISGGYFNNIAASSDRSSIGGGGQNTNTASHATISGGYYNAASAQYATVPGGNQAVASHYGQMAYAAGSFSAPGDAQSSTYVLRGTTTGSGQQELFLDGASLRMTIPNGASWWFEMNYIGRNSTGSSTGGRVNGVIKNYNNNVSLTSYVVEDYYMASGAVSGTPFADALATDGALVQVISALADNTNKALVVKATGDGSTGKKWVVVVRTVEVKF